MNAPANPHAAEARAAMQAHMAQARGEQAQPKPAKITALYPLDCKLPIVYMECNDCGCTLWWDDVASLYSAFR